MQFVHQQVQAAIAALYPHIVAHVQVMQHNGDESDCNAMYCGEYEYNAANWTAVSMTADELLAAGDLTYEDRARHWVVIDSLQVTAAMYPYIELAVRKLFPARTVTRMVDANGVHCIMVTKCIPNERDMGVYFAIMSGHDANVHDVLAEEFEQQLFVQHAAAVAEVTADYSNYIFYTVDGVYVGWYNMADKAGYMPL